MDHDPILYIVDDDCFIRELLTVVFSDVGVAVRCFSSAGDLLAHADLATRCVLLLDVRMPDMSGPELQTLLRERGLDLPIIFLSGFSDVPVAVAAIRDGARDFLIKPIDSAVLVERVRAAFVMRDVVATPNDDVGHSNRLVALTPREREVFDLMVTGATSKCIARALDCSFRTIDIHRGRVMTKMAARSLVDLVRMDARALAET